MRRSLAIRSAPARCQRSRQRDRACVRPGGGARSRRAERLRTRARQFALARVLRLRGRAREPIAERGEAGGLAAPVARPDAPVGATPGRSAACAIPARARARAANGHRRPAPAGAGPSWSGTASAAAAVGVGARASATKSQMVKSVSWPTPLTIGMRDSNTARATILFVERPQGPRSTRRHGRRSARRPAAWALAAAIAAAISAAAPAPCTGAG